MGSGVSAASSGDWEFFFDFVLDDDFLPLGAAAGALATCSSAKAPARRCAKVMSSGTYCME
jgi:hypothetical protein